MSSPPDARPSLLDFLDSFLQERNIRWILVTGLAILFGSSVMLVTTHWHDAGPLWKYLVFLGYTAATFVAGQYVCPKLGLDRTATVLLALVGLLLPVTFIAWRWTWFDANGSAVLQIASVGLLVANVALATFAGRKTIRHLLRGDQFTFLGSYVLLCLAGAVLPECPTALLLPASLLLWGVFTIGTVKVNRHVFWLAEELRLPRAFGFFPIVLLATQFVGLLAFCVAPHVSLAWLGPICVLAALTILLTADSVARVHEQRTGGIVWPWPLSIAVPMTIGLFVCIAGVALASLDVALARDGRPLVIAACLAAMIMQRVARRTNRPAFVYAMLFLATVGYNFLPSFAMETTRLVVTQSAYAVHEQRLPLAFYGLTYLPLLGALLAVGAAAKTRGNVLFVKPIEQYIAALSWLLLGLGTTHLKALGGVGLALTLVFAVHERLFRSWVSIGGTIAAWLIACAGAVPFATNVLGLTLPPVSPFLAFACGAGGLFIAGAQRRHTARSEPPYYEQASLIVSLGMAIVFPLFVLGNAAVIGFDTLSGSAEIDLATWAAGLAIATLLIVHSFRWRAAAVTTAAILFLQALLVLIALQTSAAVEHLLPLVTLGLSAQWVMARVLKARPTTVVSRVFGTALWRTLTVELSIALALGWLPLYALSLWNVFPWSGDVLQWVAAAAIIGWAFDQAVQYRHWFTALLGLLSVLGLTCTAFVTIAGPVYEPWLPVVCGATALVGLPIAEALRKYGELQSSEIDSRQPSAAQAIERPLVGLMLTVFVGLAAWSIVGCTSLSLFGGTLAATGLIWFALRSQLPILRTAAAAMVCWQVVTLPAHFMGINREYAWELNWAETQQLCFPITLLAATFFAAWMLVRREDENDVSAVVDLQRTGLGLLSLAAGIVALGVPEPTTVQVALALLAPLVVSATQTFAAWRDQVEARVWSAMSLAGVTAVYIVHWHLIRLGGQISMFALLTSGIAAWGLGKALAQRGRLGIFSRPLLQTGYQLPALNLGVALYRQITMADPHWLGPCSLALLLTAGFYFWRGVEERRPPFVLLAALFANLSLLLVWHELHVTNPQCYMIPLGATIVLLTEVLRREIPDTMRDPLRYLGAIVVLVSPIFNMLDGSWLPFLTLMVASVLVILIAIGLRGRALMYTGAGFLIADLAGMIVRGCVDHPQLLWVAGLGIGTAVVVVGAVCELKREALLARVRSLSASLEAWN